MGEVYQARDTKLDRDVALKVLIESAVCRLLMGAQAPRTTRVRFLKGNFTLYHARSGGAAGRVGHISIEP